MTSELHSTTLSSLRNASPTELEIIVKNYRDQRQADIQELIKIISEQEVILLKTQKILTSSKEWFAINLLGDIQTAIAAPLLAGLLTIRDSSFSLVSDESNPHWYSFPAAVALSKIGLPAVEYLLDLARTAHPNSTTFHISGITLEAILGEELAIFAAKQYAHHHPDFSRQDRLTILTTLVQRGHKRWTANSASDFSLE